MHLCPTFRFCTPKAPIPYFQKHGRFCSWVPEREIVSGKIKMILDNEAMQIIKIPSEQTALRGAREGVQMLQWNYPTLTLASDSPLPTLSLGGMGRIDRGDSLKTFSKFSSNQSPVAFDQTFRDRL